MNKSTREHALSLIKAGIAAVPFVGGSIASLIGDYIPTATQKTIEESIILLKRKMESLGERIDAE